MFMTNNFQGSEQAANISFVSLEHKRSFEFVVPNWSFNSLGGRQFSKILIEAGCSSKESPNFMHSEFDKYIFDHFFSMGKGISQFLSITDIMFAN